MTFNPNNWFYCWFKRSTSVWRCLKCAFKHHFLTDKDWMINFSLVRALYWELLIRLNFNVNTWGESPLAKKRRKKKKKLFKLMWCSCVSKLDPDSKNRVNCGALELLVNILQKLHACHWGWTEKKNVDSVLHPYINFSLLWWMKSHSKVQVVSTFLTLSALPGHFGEWEHKPGLDVPLLSDQWHSKGKWPSGCRHGKQMNQTSKARYWFMCFRMGNGKRLLFVKYRYAQIFQGCHGFMWIEMVMWSRNMYVKVCFWLKVDIKVQVTFLFNEVKKKFHHKFCWSLIKSNHGNNF